MSYDDMPTKNPSLFDVEGKEPTPEKLPTLKQWIKETKDVQYPVLSPIEVCWFPGKWDNYSLQCSYFRVSISPKHPIYQILDRSIVRLLTETNTALLVSVKDASGTIRVCESNFYGCYKPIGNSGYKFEPTDGAN